MQLTGTATIKLRWHRVENNNANTLTAHSRTAGLVASLITVACTFAHLHQFHTIPFRSLFVRVHETQHFYT
jgi:hypothetical protein